MRIAAWAAATVVVVGLGIAAYPAAAQESSAKKEAASEPAEAKKNPFTGQPEAIQEGRKLYLKFNCYGCHGTMGGGGMGPSLIDADWRYGAEDAKVFETIRCGLPHGMPECAMLPYEESCPIITYISSVHTDDPT